MWIIKIKSVSLDGYIISFLLHTMIFQTFVNSPLSSNEYRFYSFYSPPQFSVFRHIGEQFTIEEFTSKVIHTINKNEATNKTLTEMTDAIF